MTSRFGILFFGLTSIHRAISFMLVPVFIQPWTFAEVQYRVSNDYGKDLNVFKRHFPGWRLEEPPEIDLKVP